MLTVHRTNHHITLCRSCAHTLTLLTTSIIKFKSMWALFEADSRFTSRFFITFTHLTAILISLEAIFTVTPTAPAQPFTLLPLTLTEFTALGVFLPAQWARNQTIYQRAASVDFTIWAHFWHMALTQLTSVLVLLKPTITVHHTAELRTRSLSLTFTHLTASSITLMSMGTLHEAVDLNTPRGGVAFA